MQDIRTMTGSESDVVEACRRVSKVLDFRADQDGRIFHLPYVSFLICFRISHTVAGWKAKYKCDKVTSVYGSVSSCTQNVDAFSLCWRFPCIQISYRIVHLRNRRRDLTNALKKLSCRTLVFVGEHSPFLKESIHFAKAMNRQFTALVEVSWIIFFALFKGSDVWQHTDIICIQSQRNSFTYTHRIHTLHKPLPMIDIHWCSDYLIMMMVPIIPVKSYLCIGLFFTWTCSIEIWTKSDRKKAWNFWAGASVWFIGYRRAATVNGDTLGVFSHGLWLLPELSDALHWLLFLSWQWPSSAFVFGFFSDDPT